MQTLIVICSKYPNPTLPNCVRNLYEKQIKQSLDYKICIVDSESTELMHYRKVEDEFPDVEICYVNNKNYEYGAWKYAYIKYPNFDTYILIQDTIILHKEIPLENINNETAYTFFHDSGYNSDKGIKSRGIENMKSSGLYIKNLVDTDFRLAQHSSFIVNNKVLKNIFSTLTIPPVNKAGSCFYERNFGLYFICRNINTINLHDYMIKINGKRM